MGTKKTSLVGALFLSAGFAACSTSSPEPTTSPPPPREELGKTSSALFVNPGFESGTNNTPPPNWTVSTFLGTDNTGVTIQNPQTREGLNLLAGGTARTVTLTTNAGPGTQTDPDLGATASFRWPKFGNAVALVNQHGNQRNVNSMRQTMTIGASDIDAADGLAHVRFALAPVLEDPNHPDRQQPYFFVQLRNLTQGTILYRDFNFSDQPGVAWKSQGTYRYTDWALVDIAPGNALLSPGDQVELEIIGAGCSEAGHWGEVYVDGFVGAVPTLNITGTAPASANRGSDITYVLTYKNGGTATTAGTTVAFNTPPNTTFRSLATSAGLLCTNPAVNGTGAVTCAVGNLAANGTGTITIVARINGGTTIGSTITAGEYSIDAIGTSPFLGPKLKTTVTDGATYSDLGVVVTTTGTTASTGSAVSFTIVATNNGPSVVTGATLANPVPTQLQNATWTCTAAGGATCPAANGTGAINQAINLPSGGSQTYVFSGTINPAAAAGQLKNAASITAPASITDPTPVNNTSAAFKQITVANGVACGANTDCNSGVCHTDNLCGLPVGSGACTVANGPTICRSGACSQNNLCIATGSCNVDGDCTGGNWCRIATHTCTAKLANNVAIPTDAPHTNPTLNGQCSVAAATLVCTSSVCDVNDDRCGLPNTVGPCTAQNEGTVCRSGSCSNNNTCKAANGCNVDSDCSSTQWCNISAHACTAKLANNVAIPTDTGHSGVVTPTLDGQCTVASGALVCTSEVCNAADDRCGYPDNTGPCTVANQGTVCRSGACGVGGVCKPATGCNVDGDCLSTQWCNMTTKLCVAKLANGVAIPTDAAHTNPTLNGQCSTAAGALVCTSAVCDLTDDLCGLPNGIGPCTAANQATVCRSGACGVGGVCKPANGCNVDGDCLATEWCNIGTGVAADRNTCKPKVANGQVVPTDNGHTNPTLNGQCSIAAGTLTCVSGVCNEADDLCGYPDGSGPCTAQNGATVCRSGFCGSNGVCKPATGCNVDGDCATATEWCNISLKVCAPKVGNGTNVPTDAAHTNPTLNGTCNQAAGQLTCASAVCDTRDNKCGLADGTGPCTAQNGNTVCRSGTCSATGVCNAPNAGCNVDADCNRSTQYCDTASHACTPKLVNGSPIPNVPGHAPVVDGNCSADSGAVVCLAGVCDEGDDRCGFVNGAGSCTATNAAQVCRSGACSADGKCGLEDGVGPCSSDTACRSNRCDTAANRCGSGCKADSDCESTKFCQADGACVLKKPDGDVCSNNNQCVSAACNNQVCDSLLAEGNGFGCSAAPSSSGSSNSGGLAAFGISFVLAGLVRRRRPR